GVVAVVMWGTVLPLVSGMFGVQRVAGASFYERAAGPLLAAILALLAVGPLLPWRHAGRATLRALRWPVAAAIVALMVLLIAGVPSAPALVAFPLAAAAGATALTEYARAALRKPRTRRWSRLGPPAPASAGRRWPTAPSRPRRPPTSTSCSRARTPTARRRFGCS